MLHQTVDMGIIKAGNFKLDKNQQCADLAVQLTHHLRLLAGFGLSHIGGKGQIGKT